MVLISRLVLSKRSPGPTSQTLPSPLVVALQLSPLRSLDATPFHFRPILRKGRGASSEPPLFPLMAPSTSPAGHPTFPSLV
ncbi:hypothetical protein BDQ17DRAFT_1384176 [Cyathus striatus]|nr:hypothetical protein BDQ17DRAFT_1384176 [Cyathus striatus]